MINPAALFRLLGKDQPAKVSLPVEGTKRRKIELPEFETTFDDLLSTSEETGFDMTPPQPRTEEYLGHLRGRPKHADYEGGTKRKIFGGVLGALFGDDFGVSNPGYERATRSWADKGTGLKEAAEFEQKGVRENRLRVKDQMLATRARDALKFKITQEINDMKQFEINMSRLRDKDEAAKQIAEYRAKTMARIAQHRKEFQDATLAFRARAHSDNMAIRNRNADTYAASVGGSGKKPIPASAQLKIREKALQEVADDPRFSKWWDPTLKKFADIPDPRDSEKMLEEMDDATADAIKAEILRKEAEIVKRTPKEYMLASPDFDPFAMDDLMGEEDEDY